MKSAEGDMGRPADGVARAGHEAGEQQRSQDGHTDLCEALPLSAFHGALSADAVVMAAGEECCPADGIAKAGPESSESRAHPMQSSSLPDDGLAAACARRFIGRGVCMEDLLQEARLALLMARQRFDAERGVRFSTYAVPVILGALRERCRRALPMYVPRQESALLHQAQKAQEQLLQQGEEPTAAALSDATGAQPRLLSHALAAAERMRRLTADPELTRLAREDSFEERVLLRDAVRRLGKPLSAVIGLRYVCGMTQTETARQLGICQAKVSRLEKQGLEKLRRGWG